MNIRQYFKDQEKSGRLTQAEFGRRLGVSQQLVQNWISGIQKIGAHHVLNIEKLTRRKVTRYEMRPDVFGEKPARRKKGAA